MQRVIVCVRTTSVVSEIVKKSVLLITVPEILYIAIYYL